MDARLVGTVRITRSDALFELTEVGAAGVLVVMEKRTREALKKLLETDAEQQMADYLGLQWHERAREEQPRVDYRNGLYERDYVTPLGVIRLRIPRTRQRSFLPRWIGRLERRAPEGRADPAGVLTGDFHAPGGAGGGRADWRVDQCAVRLAADASAGPSGAHLSPGGPGR